MPVNYNVDRIISSVKRRAGTPDSQALYTDADFVSFINEAMFGDIVPSILRVHEEYFVEIFDYDIISEQEKYAIPVNSIGGKLRSVELVDPQDSSNFTILGRVSIEQLGAYHQEHFGRTVFYLEGSNIVLYPTPKSSSPQSVKLRLKYYRRPNELTIRTDGAVVNAVDTGTFILSLSNVPTSWSVGDNVDVVAGQVPFTVVGDGITITNIAGTDVTFASGDIDNVSVGDTVALQGFSITPNISMPEAHRLLEQACIIRLLEGIDDGDGLSTAVALYEKQLTSFITIITPRADSSLQKITVGNDLYDGSYRGRGYY